MKRLEGCMLISTSTEHETCRTPASRLRYTRTDVQIAIRVTDFTHNVIVYIAIRTCIQPCVLRGAQHFCIRLYLYIYGKMKIVRICILSAYYLFISSSLIYFCILYLKFCTKTHVRLNRSQRLYAGVSPHDRNLAISAIYKLR